MGSLGAPFKTVVVAGGSGGLGLFITKAFLEKKEYTVKVLTRAASASKPEVLAVAKLGADILTYIDESAAAVAKVLVGADVVVSALGAAAIGWEPTLVEAASLAGARRFVPSQFGVDTDAVKNKIALLAGKDGTIAAIKKFGLEYTNFVVGFFPDTTIDTVNGSWIGFTINDGKVIVPGDGNAKVTWTTRADIAKYVVASINDPTTANATVKLSGDTKTYNEVLEIWAKYGKKPEITYKSVADLKQEIAGNANPYATWIQQLQLLLATEDAYILPPYANYPEVVPQTVEEYIKEISGK